MRFSAAVMKKSMSSEASSVPELSQRLKESFTNVSTAAEASLFESFSLVCPANCGSGILQESTKAERAEMSSGMSFTPRGRRFLKSPLSGSGKGIRWVSEALSHSDIGWCLHNLEHYGSIIAEERQNVIQDFAMLFSCNVPFKSGIEFFGYSLFYTSNGAYKGSVVENDSFIEEYLCSQGANLAELHRIRAQLQEHLTKELAGWYKGFLGVDMFLFSPTDKEHRHALLNPVVEINLRLTMGHLFRHLAR